MNNNIIRILSNDGCIYVYNVDTNKLKKTQVVKPEDLPEDVAAYIKRISDRLWGLGYDIDAAKIGKAPFQIKCDTSSDVLSQNEVDAIMSALTGKGRTDE
jgi:hypothetical protein